MKWNSNVTTKIRVAYAKLAPFVDVKETENGDILGGFMPQILSKVAEWMNLELTFFREPHDAYGAKGVNDTGSGLVGMLFRKEVDLILNPILPREEFYEFLYYTNPITIEAYTILAGKTSTEAGLFLFFSVLDESVWIGIMIALLSISLTCAALVRSVVLPRNFNWTKTIGYYCWNLLSYTLKQVPRDIPLRKKKKKASTIFLQILVTIWALGIAFLVMNSLQGLLVSKMTLKKSKPVVETLFDLAVHKDCICFVPTEIQIDPVIKESPLEEFRRAWSNVNPTHSRSYIFQDSILHQVQGGKFCIIHGHLILENRLSAFYQKEGTCNMHISNKYFYPFSLLMAVGRELSPEFRETFNTGITRFVDADITGLWFKSNLQVSNLCTSYSDTTLRPLGLHNFYGVLLLWAAGLTLSSVALIVEISVWRIVGK